MTAPEYAQPDRIFGAAAIALEFFGDASKTQAVYDLIRRTRPPHRFPVYKVGGQWVAKRSEIAAWEERERERQAEAIGRTANDNLTSDD